MGIHGLMKLLNEECPEAIKQQELENYTGRKIAIDASMAMYQFLTAVRTNGAGGMQAASMLTNEAGEVTSHIQGMFNRTIKMMTAGIKPIYVFDGKPPQMKGGELAKRLAKRAKAETDLAEAKESGDIDEVDKFSRRLVKVTKQHNDDCKELLRLMGVPIINAPCEAEAQCAELAKKQKVFATATEDMDALTFRTPKLVRKFTFSQGKDKQPILEVDFDIMLKKLELTYEQFVDLCILCGCDYCSTIKGIGPKTALKLIKTHKCIENVILHLQKDKKYDIPFDWNVHKVKKNQVSTLVDNEEEQLEAGDDEEKIEDVAVVEDGLNAVTPTKVGSNDHKEDGGGAVDEDGEYEEIPPLYCQARQLFLTPEVTDGNELELKWSGPDEDGLRDFLTNKMGFNLDRVNNGIKKLKEAQLQKSQKRMDSFFTTTSVMVSSTTNSILGQKRKDQVGSGVGNKKGKVEVAKKSNGLARKR